MFETISRNPPKRPLHIGRNVMRYSHQHTMLHAVSSGAAHMSARILRVLVLALIALLLAFVALMTLTGHYEVGAPVIGSVLLISLGAAQHARK